MPSRWSQLPCMNIAVNQLTTHGSGASQVFFSVARIEGRLRDRSIEVGGSYKTQTAMFGRNQRDVHHGEAPCAQPVGERQHCPSSVRVRVARAIAGTIRARAAMQAASRSLVAAAPAERCAPTRGGCGRPHRLGGSSGHGSGRTGPEPLRVARPASPSPACQTARESGGQAVWESSRFGSWGRSRWS